MLKFFNQREKMRLPRRASTGTVPFLAAGVPVKAPAAILTAPPLGAQQQVHSFSNTEGGAISDRTRSSRLHGEVPPL